MRYCMQCITNKIVTILYSGSEVTCYYIVTYNLYVQINW